MIVRNFSQLGEGGGDGGFFRWEKFVRADHENETAVTGETLSKQSNEEEEDTANNKEDEDEDKADHENETPITGETFSKHTLFNTFLSFKC